MPGSYSVTLTSGGKTLTQPLTVKMDPRVKTSTADLALQFDLSKKLEEMRAGLEPIGKTYQVLVRELEKVREPAAAKGLQDKVAALRKTLEGFSNASSVRETGTLEFYVLNKVRKLFNDLQQVDAAPTPQQEAAVQNLQRDAQSAMERWKTIPPAVATLNAQLAASGIEPIKLP